MNQQLTIQEQQQNQVNDFRKALSVQTKALKASLPAHIPVERFQRAAVTAVNHNPDLLQADRQSVMNSLIKCAADGLLPDNRDAALVIFNTKNRDTNQWEKKAQYMPMVAGVIKRLRNTGEISTVEAHIVYSKDEFEFELGDDPKLYHKPLLNGERGKPLLVYCVVNFKDGMKYREVMTIAEVEKARKASKNSAKGPWADWWEEMAKKTVIHRAAKRLPSSSELDKLLQHDMKVTLNPEAADDDMQEEAPRQNTIVDNVEEALEGEVVQDEAPSTDESSEQEGSVPAGPDELFPGDIPDGMSAEEYYEQEYGSGAQS